MLYKSKKNILKPFFKMLKSEETFVFLELKNISDYEKI